MGEDYMYVRYNLLFFIFILVAAAAITTTTVPKTAEAVICPVDEIQQHANAIFNALEDYDTQLAKQEAQKLLDLTNQVEQEKIEEDKKNLNMYQ